MNTKTEDKAFERLAYVRDEKGLPVAAIAIVYDPNVLSKVCVGVAAWNKRDPYNKKILRSAALGRAKAAQNSRNSDLCGRFDRIATNDPWDELIRVAHCVSDVKETYDEWYNMKQNWNQEFDWYVPPTLLQNLQRFLNNSKVSETKKLSKRTKKVA